jgi:formate hydrogenlyase subunit 3/multisubunit Na+/H+ antiporter MnhD subunit
MTGEWLLTIMEVQFAGSMVAMLADLGRRRLGPYRARVIGSISTAFLLVSIAELLWNWEGVIQSGPQSITPLVSASIFASIYTFSSLGNLVILAVLVAATAVAAYTAVTLSISDNVGPFYALLMLLVASSVGVISAGDFLTLFLFWTGLSVAAFGLVSFERRDVSMEAAMKYFFSAATGSLLYLYGVGLIYSSTGSIALAQTSILVQSGGSGGLLGLLLVLLGIGIEVALFPVHTWLPDAYGAAPAFTGGLHGRVVNETLLFAMLKVVQPLISASGNQSVQVVQYSLVSVAILTMVVGNLGAFGQSNLRRMLAFSSIAQMGYMLAALSTFTALGFVAVSFHIWNHGLVKSNFFLLTGVGGRKGFEEADLDKLTGAGHGDRALGVLYTASSLAMVGSPPFGTFWSEILIVQSLLSAPGSLFQWVAAALLLNVVLSISYYYRVINRVVLTPAESPVPKRGTLETLPSALLVALSVATGLAAAFVIGLL